MSHNPAVLKRALQIAFSDSLFHTAKELCGFKDICEDQMPIIRALEADTRRKLVCVPRGTFKSSIASVAYPIWLMIRNPNVRILMDSELYTNSKNYLRQIKTILESRDFVRVFGDWRTDVWNESEIIIAPRTKILKDPTITVGGIGTTKVGVHVDCIIGDDYNSPANSHTHDQRLKVIEHFQFNQSILETDGIYAIIGTRYAEEDLIGWILKKELGFDSPEALKLNSGAVKGVYNLGELNE